jgi:hypothetical protein
MVRTRRRPGSTSAECCQLIDPAGHTMNALLLAIVAMATCPHARKSWCPRVTLERRDGDAPER